MAPRPLRGLVIAAGSAILGCSAPPPRPEPPPPPASAHSFEPPRARPGGEDPAGPDAQVAATASSRETPLEPASASAVSTTPAAPPSPPMSIRWSLEFPRFQRHPAESWRLEVQADGTGTWQTKGGAVPVGSEPPAGERCEGRVPPELHRQVVEAGSEAAAVACTQAPAKDGAPTLTVEARIGARVRTCKVARETPAGTKLEALRERVTSVLCDR